MDIVKDARKPTELSKFLDNYAVKTNPFGHNTSGEQAYRRAERLAAAIHLLTNHIAENEPSRLRVRNLSTDMLTSVIGLRDGFRASGGVKVRGAHADIRELISLIRILAVSGHVSFQNADTVIEALDELGYFLAAAQRSILAEGTPITREELTPRTQPVVRHVREEVVKDIRPVPQLVRNERKSEQKPKETTARAMVHHSREESVIAVLRTGGTLSIRDIAAHFPEYSEKTVQRLLADMVEEGIVRFEGMKRWRKYSLK